LKDEYDVLKLADRDKNKKKTKKDVLIVVILIIRKMIVDTLISKKRMKNF
jgi:hypothetical protein